MIVVLPKNANALKPHYFEQPAPDDGALAQAIAGGLVPPGCALGGAVVQTAALAGRDPCAGCPGPRHRCAGRPFADAGAPGSAVGLRVGTASVVARDADHRIFFLGADTAPSESHRSDDGGLMVGRATPRHPPIRDDRGEAQYSDNESDWWFDFVYARRLTSVERASARQWAAVIHQLHQAFGFDKILLDPAGGGLFVQRELKAPRQFINGAEQDVTPIVDLVTGPKEVARGYFILHLFKRGDPGIESLWPGLPGDDNLNDAAYSEMKGACDHQLVGWPPHLRDLPPETVRAWPSERQTVLRTLNESVDQFKNLSVATDEEGRHVMTKRGARQFSAQGKKDLMSAGMYCYLAFRLWLRAGEWTAGIKSENRALFSMQ